MAQLRDGSVFSYVGMSSTTIKGRKSLGSSGEKLFNGVIESMITCVKGNCYFYTTDHFETDLIKLPFKFCSEGRLDFVNFFGSTSSLRQDSKVRPFR